MGISIRKVAVIWVIVASIIYVLDLLRQTVSGLTDGAGRPLGDDFVNFWSGAFLAWHERAADVYNWPVYHAFQQTVVGGDVAPYNYSYPPILLILSAPLAILPYIPGLVVWLGASWFCFYRALRLASPGRDILLLALAVPAVFVNAYGGQNGNWTAALLGGGLCLLDRRPVIAGFLFGLLTYKPHLGLLIPIALIAGRQWRALSSATATAGALVVLSVALLGPEIWSDYLRHADALRYMAIEDGTGVWHRTISVFMFVHRLGADVQTAYLVQAAVGIAAAGIVALEWFRDAPAPTRNALLVLGTFLATPYLQDYDMVVGAFLVVWLTIAARLARLLELPALIASTLILLLPFIAAFLAHLTGQALGSLFIISAFMLIAFPTDFCGPFPSLRTFAGDMLGVPRRIPRSGI